MLASQNWRDSAKNRESLQCGGKVALTIERLFNKLKNWRRIATRYDKTAESFLGFLGLVAAKLWVPFVNRT
jgi:hypothetical protein